MHICNVSYTDSKRIMVLGWPEQKLQILFEK
jgi:hypothetical protein